MRAYPLRFADLEFAEKTVLCHSRYEGVSPRRIPYGMPWLPEHLSDVTFFLYGKTPEGEMKPTPEGTGFLVGVLVPNAKRRPWDYHVYAVTCWHVAVDGLVSNIRLRTQKGESRTIELDPEQWEFINGGADLAAVDVTDRLPDSDDFLIIPERQFAKKDSILVHAIGIGENGFMLGLFTGNPGKNRNLVAARFGNVALMANDDAPIKQENGAYRPAHLFDMRSRGGFSGSPVFVYRTPGDDLRWDSLPEKAQNNTGGHMLFEPQYPRFLALLGVHAGQYPEPATAKKITAKKKTKTKATKTREVGLSIRDGDRLEIPSGMTVVIPAWEIVDLLNKPVFRKQRDERQRLRNERDAAETRPLPEAATQVEPAADNPSHKEDFTSLLGRAARAKPKADQT